MNHATPKVAGDLRSRLSPGSTRYQTLDELVAAHPDALRALFVSAPAVDPAALGDDPVCAILGLEVLGAVYFASRPLVRLLARSPLWGGMTFDHGGNAGENRVLGAKTTRFRAAVEPGLLDGRPSLVLHFDRNPWPARAVRSELREIGEGLAIGAGFVERGGRHQLVTWFGLQRRG